MQKINYIYIEMPTSSRLITAELSSLILMEGWQDHSCSLLIANCLISGRSFSLRLSTPKRLKIKFFRYLYMNPCNVDILFTPKILVKVSGYQLWNNLPSCWNMKLLKSVSVDTTIYSPRILVLKIGPYLQIIFPQPQAQFNINSIQTKYKFSESYKLTFWFWTS